MERTSRILRMLCGVEVAVGVFILLQHDMWGALLVVTGGIIAPLVAYLGSNFQKIGREKQYELH